MQEKDRYEILFEQIIDENRAIREYVEDIPEIKQRVTRLEEKFDDMKLVMDVLVPAVKDHGRRISKLEATAQ
jgi:hypothetical protein